MTKKTAATATSMTPIAARNFKDAGTGRSFVGGETLQEVEAGELENYRAAGLLRPADMDDAQQIVADGQDAG